MMTSRVFIWHLHQRRQCQWFKSIADHDLGKKGPRGVWVGFVAPPATPGIPSWYGGRGGCAVSLAIDAVRARRGAKVPRSSRTRDTTSAALSATGPRTDRRAPLSVPVATRGFGNLRVLESAQSRPHCEVSFYVCSAKAHSSVLCRQRLCTAACGNQGLGCCWMFLKSWPSVQIVRGMCSSAKSRILIFSECRA